MMTYKEIENLLEEFSKLESNRDSYNADAIKERTIENARKLLVRLSALELYPDTVIPTNKGNISFEWGDSDIDNYFFIEVSEKHGVIYLSKKGKDIYYQLSINAILNKAIEFVNLYLKE